MLGNQSIALIKEFKDYIPSRGPWQSQASKN
jgi:hypothetical protein